MSPGPQSGLLVESSPNNGLIDSDVEYCRPSRIIARFTTIELDESMGLDVLASRFHGPLSTAFGNFSRAKSAARPAVNEQAHDRRMTRSS